MKSFSVEKKMGAIIVDSDDELYYCELSYERYCAYVEKVDYLIQFMYSK